MNINLTLLGQMIAFAVFVMFTMKYIWPPIVQALADRTAKIAEGLAAAERGQHEQELAKERAAETLREAKTQAAEIVNQAHRRAGEIVDEAKGDARTEGERILTAARAEIDQEANRAREDLRHRVAELALAGAGKILDREINAEVHRDIVDGVAAQL